MAEGFAPLADGGRLAYDLRGEHAGAPLLLIRPLGGSMALWGTFRDELARRLPVISYDLRGTGRSSDEPHTTSTRRLAEEAAQLLDHLNVSRAHVFGLSLGGMIATWLAIGRPAQIDRLCIACAPVRGLSLTRAGIFRALTLASCFARPRDQVEAALVRHVLSRAYRRAHPELVRAIEREVRQQPSAPEALLRLALAGARHDASRALTDIRAPTLVLTGERDHLLGTTPPRLLAQALTDARLGVIADSGHDVSLEQPARTASCVADFLLR